MAEESSVRVLERACEVLDCFTRRQPRLQIGDIRRITGLPATTVARLVRTLVAQELLQRDGNEYQLGLRVMVWTAPAAAAERARLLAFCRYSWEACRYFWEASAAPVGRRRAAR